MSVDLQPLIWKNIEKSDNDDIGNINVYLNKEYNFIKEMKEGLNEYK